MKTGKVLTGLAVAGVSLAAGLLLCEFVLRRALNPADYLSVEMVKDDVLGAVPNRAAGFDEWGFRNRQVPETVDIVAIGDSHTYGNTATMEGSWPYVLKNRTGRTVYNMGLGGYGPNQYFFLLTKALSLNPRIVLCGLYMGDDFENAFLITYGLDHWAYLRELPAGHARFDIWETSPPVDWHKRIRVWLSGHSVTYQLVFHGPLLGRLKGEVQIRNASNLYDAATSLSIPEKNILEAFLPKNILRNLDQESENVQEGMRITFRLLKEMKARCDQNGVSFMVVVVPTKELVFADYIEHNPKLPLSDVLDQLVANERLAREKTFQFLANQRVDCIDPLPLLRASVQHNLYTSAAADMHPNKNGYGVIAEAVVQALQQQTDSNGCPPPYTF